MLSSMITLAVVEVAKKSHLVVPIQCGTAHYCKQDCSSSLLTATPFTCFFEIIMVMDFAVFRSAFFAVIQIKLNSYIDSHGSLPSCFGYSNIYFIDNDYTNVEEH